MALVNLNNAISGRPQGPYTVKKRNPVVGKLYYRDESKHEPLTHSLF